MECIIHLRNATRGKVSVENIHPFKIPSGEFYHNGTIMSLSTKTADVSDTAMLADILNETKYDNISDIEPLLEVIAGKTVNRFIFMDKLDGAITIINEDLGMWEDDIWYSNDYHKKTCDTTFEYADDYYSGNYPYEYRYDAKSGIYKKYEKSPPKVEVVKPTKHTIENIEDIEEDVVKVFVYGTLKRGFNNHGRLYGATYLGKATTTQKWKMIGEGYPFPYLLAPSTTEGMNVEGEVYLIDAKVKKSLDSLEGTPFHYRMTTLNITYDDTKR